MYRKSVIAGMVAALVACAGGSASADLWNGAEYDFVDMWGAVGGGALRIREGQPLTYSHDITDEGVPQDYRVTEAWLDLGFTNDSGDCVWRLCGTVVWNGREYVQVGYDGADWHSLGEVDNGQYSLVVGIDWLNDDGSLDVAVEVTNQAWNTANACLDYSVLYGDLEAAHAPVPGAVLLGLVGLSLAGWKLRRYA
jgi:hypothetical protein